MGYKIGDRVYVKLSDAPEFRAEILAITDESFYVLTRENKALWVRKNLCKRWSRYQ